MKQYLDLLYKVRQFGDFKGDRTGTGTWSLFGHQMRFDLSQGFPLLMAIQPKMKPNAASASI